MARCLAGRGWDRAHAAECSEACFGMQALGVVAGGEEELRGGRVTDGIPCHQGGSKLIDDGGDHGIEVGDLVVKFEISASERLERDPIGRCHIAIVPRARIGGADAGTAEWKSRTLPRYARMTRQVEALIAGTYLAGTNTRRVRRALAAWFKGAMGKDAVSRIWRKVKTDWEAWSKRRLAAEDIVRLILDGTVVRVRLDRKATSISLLIVLGVRRDGQKVLVAVKNMGGESETAWRALLDDLVARGLKTPEFMIIDGAAGLEKALAALWPEVPTQRCTVHKHRNLLARAPDHLHDEVSADYTDMIYAETAKEIEERPKAFLRKWRLKCRAVADSLEEAGDRLFTFTRLPPSQWRSARTTNAVERLHEEFKRRIKTQTVLPSPETAAMLFWALLASGQITMRKVDGWQTLATKPTDAVIDLAA